MTAKDKLLTKVCALEVDKYDVFNKKDYDFLRNMTSRLNTTAKEKYFVKTLGNKIRVYRYK